MTVKPGPPIRLDDFRLPVADQELNGIVVDPRGKPLAGVDASASSKRTNQKTPITPRAAASGFRIRTPGGRFHLTRLPRGPIKLMVYRKQEGAGRSDQGHPIRRSLGRSNQHPDRNARRKRPASRID